MSLAWSNVTERTSVDSSLIEPIAYDVERAALDTTLFTTGTHCRYFDAEPEVVEEWMNAPSKGRYFNDEIREVYIYRQVL